VILRYCDIAKIESVQRRSTKRIGTIKSFTYAQRLDIGYCVRSRLNYDV